MNLVHIIILVLFFAIYFYWRLPKENAIRIWIDNHSIAIGNGLLVFWILFFMSKSPRLALFFGLPMLLIGGFIFYGKRRSQASEESRDMKEREAQENDPNNLGDPRDRE